MQGDMQPVAKRGRVPLAMPSTNKGPPSWEALCAFTIQWPTVFALFIFPRRSAQTRHFDRLAI